MKQALILVLVLAGAVSAQPGTRRATNVAGLLAHPAFYHLRPIVVTGTVTLQDNGEMRVGDGGESVRVVFTGTPPDGVAEVRGEFWDVGRLNADDPRLAGYDLRNTFKIDPEGAWPRPGQVLAVVASGITATSSPSVPSVRNVVLFPARYLDQKITLTGQFAGRNLLGDLPDAPGQSRYDFVLRSADAAVWVTNMRPRGRDFELSLDARIDTGRWLEVTGTLQQGRGLQWLNAEAGSLKVTQAPRDLTEDGPIRVPSAPPPEVVFSTPTAGETDVLTGVGVRIQFSRDINPATFRGNIRVTYVEAGAPSPGAPATETPPAAEFTTQYLPGTRVLQLKFTAPLAPFRTVQIELLDSIIGTDSQPLKPWTLTFQTGGT
jgi:Bacterial Ig-like domain